MARYRCEYFGFILGFLIVKCIAQDVVTPRIEESENSTEEVDNFYSDTVHWNTSTELRDNVTERTDYTVGTQTSVTSSISSTDSISNVSKNDIDITPFVRPDSTTSNNATEQENATKSLVQSQPTSSTNFDERSSTVEINNNSINDFSTDIPEMNASTSMPPLADNFSTVNDVIENVSLVNRTILSTDTVKVVTNAETETTESHNLLSLSDGADNTSSSVESTFVTPSTNPFLNDTVSDVFAATTEPALTESHTDSTHPNENLATANVSDGEVSIETTKSPSLSSNETETTRSFGEETSRQSSSIGTLDNLKTQPFEFTSEPSQVDTETTTDQVTDRGTSEPSKVTVSVDSTSDISSNSVNVVFDQSTTGDIIDSTVSPAISESSTASVATSLLYFSASDSPSKSTADDKENSTQPFVTLSTNVNATNSPDDTIVTSTENDTSKTSSVTEDMNNATEREDSTTEISYESTIFELTTTALTPIVTEYNSSDTVSTASTLPSRNESINEFTTTTKESKEEESSTIPPSPEVSSSPAQELTPTTISFSSPTVSERNDSSQFPGLTLRSSTSTSDEASTPSSLDDAFTNTSAFTSTTSRLSTEKKISSIRPSPDLSTLNTEQTISDVFTTVWDAWKINKSSTQEQFTSTAASSFSDSTSEFTTASGFSTEKSTVQPSSGAHPSTTESITPDSFPITWTEWKINESSTSPPSTTTESYSTSINDSATTTPSYVGSSSGLTSKSSTEEKTSSIWSSSPSSPTTESTIPDILTSVWTSSTITESSTLSSLETTQQYSPSTTPNETLSTTEGATATPTDEVKKVSKCLANETEMEPGNAVTVVFSFPSVNSQQGALDDGNYENRFQLSALACFDAQLHLTHGNEKNENTHGTVSSEEKNENFHSHFDPKDIKCAPPSLSPEEQTFSITFYVRDFINGSTNAIPSNTIVQSLKSCKSKIEEEVGLNITSIFEKLKVPTAPEEDTQEESILQRHASVFISVSLVLGLLLIFGTIGFAYFFCCNHSRHYDTEKKKLKQDMATSIEIGDMIPANEILNGEMREKDILGLSNGSSAHLIRMEDDGWVAPYSEVPLEDKNPPDVQDTKL